MAPPTWFEVYGLPGSGKSSSRAWFWKDICQNAAVPKSIINIGDCLMDEKTIEDTFDCPHKYTYFTQREILKNYSSELDQIEHSPAPGDVVFEHVPLGTIQCFNTALYFHNYFPSEGMRDLQSLEEEIWTKRSLTQMPYVVKRVYIDTSTKTCWENLQARNPAVYQAKKPVTRFEKHFLRVMNLVNALLSIYVKGLEYCQKISYKHGVLFDGHLRDLYLNSQGSTNRSLDFVDHGDKTSLLLPPCRGAGPTFMMSHGVKSRPRPYLSLSALSDIDEEDDPMTELEASMKKTVI